MISIVEEEEKRGRLTGEKKRSLFISIMSIYTGKLSDEELELEPYIPS